MLSFNVTDNQRAVNAQLVGQDVLPTDQYNLQWKVDDPTIIKLVGTTGPSVLLKPLKPGETALKITHEKTDTVFSIHIEVTGNEQGISLNKSYMALETGKTIELTATIDNGTAVDYGNITWSADKVNNLDIVSILGSGKTVAIYGLSAGRTKVSAEWNGGKASCDVVVTASRQFTFDTQTLRVQPGQTKAFKYTLVPDDANIQWFTNTNEYITYEVDTDSKTVRVTGIKENPLGGVAMTSLSAISNSMRASISITTAWDYKLSLGKTHIKAEPRHDPNNPDKFIIPYDVHPENARIEVTLSRDIADVVVDKQKKQIILTPTGEGDADLFVTAYNVNTSTPTVFPNMQRNCKLYFHYRNLNIRPSIISKTGSFSRYDEATGILIIGDGEEVELGFGAQELNADWSFSPPVIVHKDSKSPIALNAGTGENTYKVKHPADTVKNEYLIRTGYVPIYYTGGADGSSLNSGGIWQDADLKKFRYWSEIDSWYYLGTWYNTSYFCLGYNGFTFFDFDIDTQNQLSVYDSHSFTLLWSNNGENGLQGACFSRRREPTLDGKILSESEFESTPWYFCPGCHIPVGSSSLFLSSRILTENIDAIKRIVSDKTVISSLHTDNLVLSYKHNGKDKKITIPIYTETRNCPYNQE